MFFLLLHFFLDLLQNCPVRVFFSVAVPVGLRILEEKYQQITSCQDLAVHLENDTPHTRNKSTKGQTVNHRVYIFVFLRVITIQAQVAHLCLEVFIAVDSALRSWSNV